MRPLLIALSVVSVLAGGSAALAEKRIIILDSNAEAYGIDRCLATGARCGNAMATALCRQHDFKQAVSYRKIDRDEITGSMPGSRCRGTSCENFVAIECAR